MIFPHCSLEHFTCLVWDRKKNLFFKIDTLISEPKKNEKFDFFIEKLIKLKIAKENLKEIFPQTPIQPNLWSCGAVMLVVNILIIQLFNQFRYALSTVWGIQ